MEVENSSNLFWMFSMMILSSVFSFLSCSSYRVGLQFSFASPPKEE